MALEPGTIFQEKYRIVRRLGKGGMGSVYEAENTRIQHRVAIKILHSEVSESAEFVKRFEREATAAGRIGSEHIVEVLDLGKTPDGESFMILEYLEGEDLKRRIKRRGRLSGLETAHILNQTLIGLGAAHDAEIVHRDMKPDNIYLLKNRAGLRDFVKILDFGVSKFSGLDHNMDITKAGAIMGTPYYMSPEQARGDEADYPCDIYAVGVIMYQMLSGKRPFEGKNFNDLLFQIALEPPPPLIEHAPDCPPELVAIVTKAMARDPKERYPCAEDFRAEIEAWERKQVDEEGHQLSYSGPYSNRGRLSRSGSDWADSDPFPDDGQRVSHSSVSVTGGPISSREISVSVSGISGSTNSSSTMRSSKDRTSIGSQAGLSVAQPAGSTKTKSLAPLIVVACTLAVVAVAGAALLVTTPPANTAVGNTAAANTAAANTTAANTAGATPAVGAPGSTSATPQPSTSPAESSSAATDVAPPPPSASASAAKPEPEPQVSRPPVRPHTQPPPTKKGGSTVVGGRRLKTGL